MLSSRRACLWVLGASLVGACSLRDLSDLEGEAAEQGTGGAGGTMETPTGGSDGSGGNGGQGGETPLGGAPSTGGDSGTGGEVEPPPDPRAYSHSITCDGGRNDWITAEHEFESASGSFAYRVSWDSEQIYLYAAGSDFVGALNRTATFYIGDGSTDGQPSGRALTTDVSLPYFAQLLIQVNQNSGTADAYRSDSANWSVDQNLGDLAFRANTTQGFFELCLDRAAFGLDGEEFLLSGNVANLDDSGAAFGVFPAEAFAGTAKNETASFGAYFRFTPDEETDPPLPPTGYSPVVP